MPAAGCRDGPTHDREDDTGGPVLPAGQQGRGGPQVPEAAVRAPHGRPRILADVESPVTGAVQCTYVPKAPPIVEGMQCFPTTGMINMAALCMLKPLTFSLSACICHDIPF